MSEKPKKYSNYGIVDFKNGEKIKHYINSLDKDVFSIVSYLDIFPRMFSQSAQPTIQRNTFALWHDTDDNKMYLLWNWAGTTKKVELT